MARSKSPAASKAARTPKQEEAGVNLAASVAEVKPGEVKPIVTAPAPGEITTHAPAKPQPSAETKAEIKTEPRKLEVRKNDRKNLFPINLDDEIRRRAYELYEQRGARGGSEAEDWFNAEREIRQRYHQQSA